MIPSPAEQFGSDVVGIPFEVRYRNCGQCTACCVALDVQGSTFEKKGGEPCPKLKGCNLAQACTVHNTLEKPQVCTDFQCAWTRGFGSDEDSPDKCGVLLSRNGGNNGTWIFAIELQPNALLTTGKSVVMEIASKIQIPVIVGDFGNSASKGDRTVIHKSLLPNTNRMRGELLGYLDSDQEFGVYKLKA